MVDKIRVKTFGKVILSGEHAVVHGAPAIGCPSPFFTLCTVEKVPKAPPHITLELKNLKKTLKISFIDLIDLKEEIEERYALFLRNKLNISDVLKEEEELLLLTLGFFFEKYPLTPLSITLESTIALGSGLGSSAAAISSLIKSLNDCLGNPLNESTLFEIALKAENRQHGRSSGVDIAICLKNAPIFFEKGDIVELNLKIPSFTLLSTGKPAATTGESVAHTTAVFQKKPKLLEAFALVTRELAKPQKEERFLSLIRENHALLKEIGVVPKRVSQLIEEIEHLGGAAKITGAGSVKGECAGAILVFKPKEREIDFQGKSE